MFPHHSYTTANAESDYERDSERESDGDGEDEVSCETVKMGRKDSLDLEVEVALGPEPEALEAGGSPSQEDVLLLLQQADELHQGSEQGKREGFQLLLNNKLAVRLRRPVYLPSPCSHPRMSMTLPGDTYQTSVWHLMYSYPPVHPKCVYNILLVSMDCHNRTP